MRKDEVWIGPVTINGITYEFPTPAKLRDGNRLWTVSVALADYVSTLTLTGTSIEIGCGLGLVGRVANAVMIDRDSELADVIHKDWKDVSEQYDNIFGSEIIYPAYDPASIADFIDRCWSRKGKAIFAVSRPQYAQPFEARLAELNLHFRKETQTYNNLEYTTWELDGENI